MNALLKIHEYSKDKLSFLDTKNNTLISGLFTKINYSDALITMYGVYINIPIEINIQNKNYNSEDIYNLFDLNNNIKYDI